ncbi:hypothetical protein GN278_08820 [Rhodobacteraceae bacterium Araon29]
MTRAYDPPRQLTPRPAKDPMEIELVYNVRPCGTCNFFWPKDPSKQIYGPYPIYDFLTDYPKTKTPDGTPEIFDWVKGVTREEGYPNGEVMDGCRKAPIMTMGINPNMTAFSPGTKGTSWVYPGFTDDDNTDGFAKYAYYYRYRNVYQERFAFDEVKKFLIGGTSITPTANVTVTEDQVIAAEDGKIIEAKRTDAGPTFEVGIEYTSGEKIQLTLERDTGTPRYVLLFDHEKPDNAFKKGDAIISKMSIPADEGVDIYQELQTYYEQFVPTLNAFSHYLDDNGHTADLQIGEDVCQLDMVACASPHWNPGFLGGSKASENKIILNCVTQNGWALKQLIMTKPAVLFLVGESSYTMFRHAFGAHIKRDPPLPVHPYDNAFTLFRETADNDKPTMFSYSTNVDGQAFEIDTLIIVTPHFSYDANFLPQFRLSHKWLADLKENSPECVKFLETDKRITFDKAEFGYDAFQFSETDAPAILAKIKSDWPRAWSDLKASYYNAHETMADVLGHLYDTGALSWDDAGNYLSRGAGPCKFCVNTHWQFPEGCPYGKPDETPLPIGFLDKVAAEISATGKG